MTRVPPSATILEKLGAEVVRGDLRDPASLSAACHGTKAVVASAHGFTGKGLNNPDSVDRGGHRSLIDAASRAGVEQFVYVSVVEIGPDHPLDFFRIKWETEEYLKASGLPWTVVRGSAFMETWVDTLGTPIRDGKRVMILGSGDNAVNTVSVEDVADLIVLALQREALRGRALSMGGPENLTIRQLVTVLENVIGRPARRSHIPLFVLRVMSRVVAPFNATAGRMLRGGVIMSSTRQTFNVAEVPEDFPHERLRFEDVARKWNGSRRPGTS